MKKTIQFTLGDCAVTATQSGNEIWFVQTWGDKTPPDAVDEDTDGAIFLFSGDLKAFCQTMMDFFK